MTVYNLVKEQILKTPDSTAITVSGKRFSYKELGAEINTMATYLHDSGVKKGDIVGISVKRSFEMVVSLLGIIKIGASYLPLDPDFPPGRLNYMIKDSQCQFLLTESSHKELFQSYSGKLIEIEKYRLFSSNDNDYEEIDENNLVYVLYTSGSTGNPKGVCVTHNNLNNFLLSVKKTPGITDKDSLLAITTLSFDISGLEIFLPLISGANLIIATKEEAKDGGLLVKKLKEATILQATPATWNLLLSSGWNDKIKIKALCGGEQLTRELANKILERVDELWNMYGPTETTIWSSCCKIEKGNGTIHIGKPIANTQFYILDKNFNLCPPGVPGELFIGGKGLSAGYLNNEKLTNERFVINPFDKEKKSKIYRTGDLVKLNSQKELEFLGRIDEQVKIRGFRIELGEIESVLMKNGFVKDAAVISRDFGNGDNRLIAFYTPNGYSNSGNVLVQDNSIDWKNNWEELYRNVINKNSPHKNDAEEIGFLVVDQFDHDDNLRKHYLEWINSTTERIKELKPKRVLEIGCGGGDILKRIINDCEFYAATDISKTIIEHLNTELEKLNINKTSYQLINQTADEDLPFPKKSFDTIIINSVIQYFPDQYYLSAVLDKLLDHLKDDGCLFVGDVQSFSLLPNFNFYDQLRFVAKDIKVGEFKKLNTVRLKQVPELFIDPEFFHSYLTSKSGNHNIEIKLMRGSLENEPIIYHYDVYIYPNREKYKHTVKNIKWNPYEHSISYMSDLLKNETELIYIEGIPNKRIGKRIFQYQTLENSDVDETVFDVLNVPQYNGRDIDPENIWALENDSYKVELFLPLLGEQTHFNAAFIPKALNNKLFTPEYLPPKNPEGKNYCNNPSLNFVKEKISEELKKYLQLSLPDYMIPSNILEVKELPLTPNNKIDKKALQSLEISEFNLHKKTALPVTDTEKIFFEIWKKLLGHESLSIDDNFFELGGHSILAAQMFTDYERITGRRIPLATLFSAQSIRQLSFSVDENKQEKKWSPVVEIKKGNSDLPPLFLIHGAEGNVLLYRDLANRLKSQRSVYGLQSRGLNGTDKINKCIEEMAEDYLTQIKLIQPKGPYNLGGYCMGGTIAYEMSRQLKSAGDDVNILLLLETYNACTIENGNTIINRTKERLENLKFHFDNIKILKGAERADFIKIKTETFLMRSSARMNKIQTKLGLEHKNEQKSGYISLSLRKINDLAQLKYKPLLLECNVVLLKPKISFSSEPDPKFGWGDFIKGDIKIFNLDVAPRGMLVEPFVKITARIIDQELTK